MYMRTLGERFALLPAAVQRQMDKMPLQNLLKQAGKAVTPEMAQRLNNALNQIPRVS